MNQFSLLDPSQLFPSQQMPAYQAPQPTPATVNSNDWGMTSYLQNLNSDQLDFSAANIPGQSSTWGAMSPFAKTATVASGASALSSLANMYLGFKAIKSQERMNKFQRKAWNMNWTANVQDYENQLRDRYTRLANQANIEGRTMTESLESFLNTRKIG